MAHNLQFYGKFSDNVNKDTIDIYIKRDGFVGTAEELLLDENPLVLTYPKHDFDTQLFGLGCKINVINVSTNFFRYDDLFSFPEQSCKVEIIKTSTNIDSSIVLFEGFVLPEMYTTTLEKNIKVTIPATDYLSNSDRFSPKILIDDPSYRADEYINAFDLIGNCIVDMDVTDKIAIHCDLETINYVKDGSSTIFNNVFFNSECFNGDKGVESEKVILEKILKPFYSRLYYTDNKWRIDRLADITNPIKDYILYIKSDASPNISQWNVSNEPIALDTHNIIENTARLTYNPGFKKLVTTLNYKLPESMVENYFWDTEYYNKNDVSTISTKPQPKLKRWMMSAVNSSISFEPVSFTGLDSGLWFFVDVWSSIVNRYTWFQNQYASTKFIFAPNETRTEINISFKAALASPMAESFSILDKASISASTNFALRACDSEGKDWWIAKAKPTDNSTYWSATPYKFNVSRSWNDIVLDNYIWEIDETINVTQPIIQDVSPMNYVYTEDAPRKIGDWMYFSEPQSRRKVYKIGTYFVPTKTQYPAELYLDIYPMTYNPPDWFITFLGFPAGYFLPYYTWFGDVDVDVQAGTPFNMLEASLGDFSGTIEKTLDIFDTSIVQYTNGLYNLDNQYVLSSIDKWRDDPSDNYIKIQNKYMEDLSQMYWKPRYNLDIDVRSKDSSLFTLGNIYTHKNINRDASLVTFICNGYDYNVKENTYRMHLSEFIADDNWRNDPGESYSPPPAPSFTIKAPSSFLFGYTGQGSYNYIDVSTNVSYTFDTSENWLTLLQGPGGTHDVSVYCDENYEEDRDGSIWFYPSGLSNQVLSVHQDSSSLGFIEFDDLGVVTLNSIVENVDISIYITSNAKAESLMGYGKSTYAEGWMEHETVQSEIVLTGATAPPNDASTKSTLIEYTSVSSADDLFAGFSMGDWANDYEAVLDACINYKITNCKLSSDGTSDVDVNYNTFSVYYNYIGSICKERSNT